MCSSHQHFSPSEWQETTEEGGRRKISNSRERLSKLWSTWMVKNQLGATKIYRTAVFPPPSSSTTGLYEYLIGNWNQRILVSGEMLHFYPQNRTIYGTIMNYNTEGWVWSLQKPAVLFWLAAKVYKVIFYSFWSKTWCVAFICLSQNLFGGLGSWNLRLLIQVVAWTNFTTLRWQLTTKIKSQLVLSAEYNFIGGGGGGQFSRICVNFKTVGSRTRWQLSPPFFFRRTQMCAHTHICTFTPTFSAHPASCCTY